MYNQEKENIIMHSMDLSKKDDGDGQETWFGIDVRFTLYWKNLVLMIFPRQQKVLLVMVAPKQNMLCTESLLLLTNVSFANVSYNYIQCS